jgi:hypothetical protein
MWLQVQSEKNDLEGHTRPGKRKKSMTPKKTKEQTLRPIHDHDLTVMIHEYRKRERKKKTAKRKTEANRSSFFGVNAEASSLSRDTLSTLKRSHATSIFRFGRYVRYRCQNLLLVAAVFVEQSDTKTV